MSQLESFFWEKDVDEALNIVDKRLSLGENPFAIHEELFPLAQYVINPPFINPHIPKMHSICGSFYEYLNHDEAGALLKIEVSEYVRRDHINPAAQFRGIPDYSMDELKKALGDGDRDRVANILSAIGFFEGKNKLVEKVLRLCSGYLDKSLGHSVSCTSFILLEYVGKGHRDSWPSFTVLADYLCKGQFFVESKNIDVGDPYNLVSENILRGVSGTGIENLHDTLTIYSIEAIKSITGEELNKHLVGSWLFYLGDKKAEPYEIRHYETIKNVHEYKEFYKVFQQRDSEKLTSIASDFMGSVEDRRKLVYFLVKSLCDSYNGKYNPHYFTGLSSLRWVIDKFNKSSIIYETALYQYLDFLFT